MELSGSIEKRSSINRELTGEMIELLNECFVNVQRETFLRDLQEKDEVFLLRTAAGQLCGFSTIVFFRHTHAGESYRVIFSGDTVISPRYWGTLELPIHWGIRMMEYWEEEASTPLLWMLISKGIRTYKFLPVFFRSYFPNHAKPVPGAIHELMKSLGERRFPNQYNPATGLIEPAAETYYLRPEFASAPPPAFERPELRLFFEHNPSFRTGAELLCLCEFTPENLRPFIRRQIELRRGRKEQELDAA